MSSRVDIIKKCLSAFYNDLDVSVLATYTTDSFKALILPESLGVKEMTKEEHMASGEKMVGNLKEYSLYEPIEIFESGNKVTAHVRAVGVLKDGTEYKHDTMFILTFNEEGNIIYSKEFVDSLEMSKVAAKLMA
ncbi:hypothetical protein DL96DRAFT_1607085 [Flagelloscypha sp. PMI_526]|nr:hypothetical protein DL96DRAFT_1607085 [Flagelloscypha sp. PMI_526]